MIEFIVAVDPRPNAKARHFVSVAQALGRGLVRPCCHARKRDRFSAQRKSQKVLDRLGLLQHVAPPFTHCFPRRAKIHIYDDRLVCHLGATEVFLVSRRHFKRGGPTVRVIDYRHLVPSLVKKPQAFRHSVFRDELFPRPAFRRAWRSSMRRSIRAKPVVSMSVFSISPRCMPVKPPWRNISTR